MTDSQRVTETAPIDMIARSGDTAFISGEDRWSYDQFATEIDRLAAGMAARGIRPGDRVALHLRNGPEIAVAYYACFRLGAIAAPLNLRFKPAELEEVLGRLTPNLYLGHADLYARVAGLDTAILGAEDRYVVGATEEPSARSWTDLLGDPAATPPPGQADLHAPVVLLLTSGTTGQPKLVAHSISTLTRAVDQFACLGFTTGGVHAFLRPMVHASGLFFMLYTTRLRMTQVMLDPTAPEAILDAIEKHRCTYLPVPVFSCDALIEGQRRKPRDLSSLTACGISADICPPGRQDAFRSV
ncbi:MAG: AMP-binding protein, partial [Dongiaceae bacterium]